MDKGTNGCMYNCGDSCTGECMTEFNPKKSVVERFGKLIMKKDTLYSEIEHLIIRWNIDGTKTAGSLTRDIMKLIESYE